MFNLYPLRTLPWVKLLLCMFFYSTINHSQNKKLLEQVFSNTRVWWPCLTCQEKNVIFELWKLMDSHFSQPTGNVPFFHLFPKNNMSVYWLYIWRWFSKVLATQAPGPSPSSYFIFPFQKSLFQPGFSWALLPITKPWGVNSLAWVALFVSTHTPPFF